MYTFIGIGFCTNSDGEDKFSVQHGATVRTPFVRCIMITDDNNSGAVAVKKSLSDKKMARESIL